MLLQGYELTGERRMLDAAQAALDYVLGRNATNLSQVTGLGSNPAKHPHHRPLGWLGGKAVPGFLWWVAPTPTCRTSAVPALPVY